jgi:CRP-like cAMP-binding protein
MALRDGAEDRTVPPDLLAVVNKVETLSPLPGKDRSALLSLPCRNEQVGPGTTLVREGDRATECCLLLRGYAFRHKGTRCGRRQIVSFHMDGDFLDLQHLKLARADHSVETLTDADIAWVSHADLDGLIRGSRALTDALWRDALIDASVFREWILNVGRRSARSRIAHLLCELGLRRTVAGIGKPDRFELPMTQEHIADATGMTIVHVNRTLRSLTEDGAIERNAREVRVRDWHRLRRIADFDPAYLHLVE